jgi:hypothetical protein
MASLTRSIMAVTFPAGSNVKLVALLLLVVLLLCLELDMLLLCSVSWLCPDNIISKIRKLRINRSIRFLPVLDSRLCWFLRMVTCVCLHRSSVTFVSVYGAADLHATSSSTVDVAGYGSESTGSKS